MSETMILHQAPETTAVHRALWAGRILSALVVVVLVADGTIRLFAPAQIASMLQETGFAMDLTHVVGPIILACAILYAIPAAAGTNFVAAGRDDMGRTLPAISPYPGSSTAHPLTNTTVLCPSRSGENTCF